MQNRLLYIISLLFSETTEPRAFESCLWFTSNSRMGFQLAEKLRLRERSQAKQPKKLFPMFHYDVARSTLLRDKRLERWMRRRRMFSIDVFTLCRWDEEFPHEDDDDETWDNEMRLWKISIESPSALVGMWSHISIRYTRHWLTLWNVCTFILRLRQLRQLNVVG